MQDARVMFSLTSPEYFLFLSIVFFAYWLGRRCGVNGLLVILTANYFFYARWSWIYLVLMPLVAGTDYLIGRALGRTENKLARKWLLAGSVGLNVSLIAAFRYIPLGLSFYAFQALTYTIDVYRGDSKPTKDFVTYLASVSFFPTTLAGPITRVGTVLNQWQSSEVGKDAVFRIGRGLAKKFLLADYLAINLVNRAFDLPKLYSSGEVLVAVYAYSWQLYYDFSGYSDIAIGSAQLFGIKLPENFNHPYRAENLVAFWKRWHITLSNWLRDYLYFSLPGKRGNVMPYLNLVITFLIGGLWHGLGWTFAVWGLLHGVGLVVVRLRRVRKGGAFSALFTYHFVVFAWIFFRAADLRTALQILAQIGGGHWTFDNVALSSLTVLLIAMLLHFVPDAWAKRISDGYAACPAVVQATALAAVVLGIRYVAATGTTPFIYSKF